MVLPIVKVPNSVLRTKAKQVKKFDAKLQSIVRNMEDTVIAAKNPIGVGLAAPQIGLSIRVFVTRPKKNSLVRTYINPEIIRVEQQHIEEKTVEEKKKNNSTTLEGCLSVDKIWSPITRPQKVLLRFTTPKNEVKEQWFEGFSAVIIQHELDHLNGILFTQRALEQKAVIYEEKKGKLREIEM